MADSLYDRLGGIDAITAVVGSFRDRVAGDDRINLKFARTDLARLTKMLIDQPQAFALPLREQVHRIVRTVVPCAHSARSKRRLEAHVYFNAKD